MYNYMIIKTIVVSFLTFLIGQRRKVVNVFTRVFTVRNAKSKIEVKRFEKSITEKVTFDHSKILNRLVSNDELDAVQNKDTRNI